MNRPAIAAAIVAVAVALGVGYLLGQRAVHGRPAEAPLTEPLAPAVNSADKGRILYYRHPMGLPDTSPVPKRDAMGMDYVPVYEHEVSTGPGFVIPDDKLQRLGVRTTEATSRTLTPLVRAVGTVQVDERRQAAVSAKFEGYVTRLHVATTGAPIRRGEPLLEVYSPDLVSAQEEYLIARRNLTSLEGAGPDVRARLEGLVEASRARLRNWDIDPKDLAQIDEGRVQKNVLIRSPVDGIVLEKMAKVGQRFMPGEPLYQVAGLQTVWLVANVFEQDLAALATDRPARASFDAYPGRMFEGRVSFVYPALQSDTRTLAVRIELPNPYSLLKPGLYGTVEIDGPSIDAAVTVPDSAVLDSGTRRLVFVAREGGRFEAREIEVGARANGFAVVQRGLAAGEPVVVDGNFLIDAESSLRAGAQSLGHAHGGESPRTAPETAETSVTPPAPAAPEAVPNPHAGH